jgi:PTH1 family peptidyl-tRNA hydrolase
MESLHLIAGLGNPGTEYAQTRHNAGSLVVERLAGRWDARWALSRRFNALLARVRQGPRGVLLCRPQTFMNVSGEAVAALVKYHQVALDRLVVVVDDADLPLGMVRMRPQGSSAGHHGLESVEQHLGTCEYSRVRVGIGRTADGRREITAHVLGRFTRDEQARLDQVLDRAADQVECWLSDGVRTAMDRFNGWVGNTET